MSVCPLWLNKSGSEYEYESESESKLSSIAKGYSRALGLKQGAMAAYGSVFEEPKKAKMQSSKTWAFASVLAVMALLAMLVGWQVGNGSDILARVSFHLIRVSIESFRISLKQIYIRSLQKKFSLQCAG